jgi:EpsI family protein
MKKTAKSWMLLVFMLASAALSWSIYPRISMADSREYKDIASMIPSQFGDWQELKQSNRQIVNPQQTTELDKLYSETLSRSYVNSAGTIIMLSIAYGKDQSRDLQIHRPEVCYSAQGFQIVSTEKTTLNYAGDDIPAMHIVAQQGQRNEPITYWVRIGEKVVRGNLEQGFARLGYGLSGYMPDGVLLRVSSISEVNTTAFEIQKTFIFELLQAVPITTKSYLLGEKIA